MKLYRDYFWKMGLPYGLEPVESFEGYKIVMDPYRKRVCIEHYTRTAIPDIIYDSALIDFRHLRQPEHAAWQKSVISETADKVVCLIRDQNDRLLFVETHSFADNLCRSCRVTSPHGIELSRHQMFYTLLNDPFDGVILYDSHGHPVMSKRYEYDKDSQQFTQLLEENWEMAPQKAPGANP